MVSGDVVGVQQRNYVDWTCKVCGFKADDLWKIYVHERDNEACRKPSWQQFGLMLMHLAKIRGIKLIERTNQ